MWKSFLRERLSWILFVLIWLSVIDALLLLEYDIKVSSTSFWYLNLLTLCLLILFLLWRGVKEKKFLKKLSLMLRNDAYDLQEMQPYVRTKADEDMLSLLQHIDRVYRRQTHALHVQQREQQEYVTTWVHEIKTPLTAMKLLINAHRTELYKWPWLKDIEDEWMKIDGLVDQNLYSARLQYLEKDYQVQAVSLSELVFPNVAYFSKWCIEKKLHIDEKNLDILVYTDSKWMQFVVRQVLSNAIKYSPLEGKLSFFSEETPKYVKLFIADQGKGIPTQDLPRVFEKGFTGNAGRKTKGATGLGLYFSKKITDALGHQIEVNSLLHEGTTVILTFYKPNSFDNLSKM
jgi:two-component system, OmpR family, bacitracin resistance sensor histidine kinase BceS